MSQPSFGKYLNRLPVNTPPELSRALHDVFRDIAKDLSDLYREGDWTPGVSFGGASSGVTYETTTFNRGRYIKVGKFVCVTFRLQLTNKGVSVGNAALTGLPFTSSASEARGGGGVGFYGSFAVGVTTPVHLLTDVSSTTAAIYQGTAGTSAQLTNADFTNTSILIGSFCYEAVS